MAGPLSTPGPWDRVAQGYVEAMQPLLAPFALDALDALGLEPAHAILDVAAGPGTLSLIAAPRVARVEAIDFSPTMVGEFDKALATSGATNVSVQQADGQALPFADGRFDRAFSNFGVGFFPDRARGFRELHRVLKPGGRAAVTSWQPLENSSYFRLLLGCLDAAGALPKPAPDAEPTSNLDDPDGFQDELEAAGFVDVEIRELSHAVPVESIDSFWAQLELGNVGIHEMRLDHGDDRFDAIAEKARAWLTQHVETPGELQVRAYLGIASKRESPG